MKLYPRSMSMLSVTLLGVLIAACSSKSTDDGGGDTNPGGLGGAANVGQGGGVSTATGGRITATATGGQPVTTATGGVSNVANLPKACMGLPITTAAAGAGSVDADAGAQCAGVGVELEPSPLDIYVMMDRTYSMTYTMGNGSAVIRWNVLQSGVSKFVNDPGVLQKAPRVGLKFFGATGNPTDPQECDANFYANPLIEIEDLNTSGPKIEQAMTDVVLGGQTPWSASLQGALMHAQDWQIANPSRMTIVVLVTDGYPTECDTDVSHIQELVGEFYSGIAGAYNARGKPGIRTYIIGVAVDKFNLNAVAQAGGTGQATIVDSASGVDAFVSAMVNITNANISCDIPLPAPPSGQVLNPDAVQVVYNPFVGTAQQIPKADTAGGCGAANGGWYFDNPASPTKISLCPCSCANLGAGGIQIRFGCRPALVIN